MVLLLIILYIIIGALLGSVYYYMQLRRDKHDNDIYSATWIGILWPVVAPFAFGFYYAKEMSRKDGQK